MSSSAERPRLELERTTIETVLEVVALLALVGSIVIVALKAAITLLGLLLSWVSVEAGRTGEAPAGAALGFYLLIGATLLFPLVYFVRAGKAR